MGKGEDSKANKEGEKKVGAVGKGESSGGQWECLSLRERETDTLCASVCICDSTSIWLERAVLEPRQWHPN